MGAVIISNLVVYTDWDLRAWEEGEQIKRELYKCGKLLMVTVPPTCRKGVERGTAAIVASS